MDILTGCLDMTKTLLKQHLTHNNQSNVLLFKITARPGSVTARAVQDKVFSLIKASIQSDDEESGKYKLISFVFISFF